MKSSDIRKSFLGYFEKNQHQVVPSSNIVPDNDPTLLFTNAGMNQFKNTFTGIEKRDYSRATSSQKCIRAGGKHNDLENVGFTARHHTFFEMLGNFSFGDYFKKEAIHFAWDYSTKVIGLDKDKLYVTVFETDDEAADIWHKQEGVPKDRIYRFGEKDNFWRMGNTGPCGPCSEIFYDLGPEVGGNPKDNVMGGEGDRFMEFWNLVFMQYNEDEDGNQNPLPKPSVDTGMGLERLATIIQGKLSNYDTDTFQALIQTSEKISGLEYIRDFKKVKDSERQELEMRNVAMRVLADHARAAAFLIAEGVLPSNEGRGYVLRRIMRRAIRYGRNLKLDTSFLPGVVESVIDEMGGFFGELNDSRNFVLKTVHDEEKRFFQTLDQGSGILNSELGKLSSSGSKTLSGKTAFKLYDTFGFPLDLTSLIAKERGFQVDETGFEQHLQEAKEVARSSWKGKGLSVGQSHIIKLVQGVKDTEFTGYTNTKETDKIAKLSNGESEVKELKADETGVVIFNKTCFYGESGGQAGDVGILNGPSGSAEVLDTTKTSNIHILHIKVTDGVIKLNDEIKQQVDETARRNTMAHHSATHLLHAALRTVLGDHVTQAGSLVAADKLRFDFTHDSPVSQNEIEAIENLVNAEISKATEVKTDVMTPDQATKAGALALFGEKYGDKVRVLTMGPFSMELCGGTHVPNTAHIRSFKIVGEAGVSSGVRRIEALAADAAQRFFMKSTRENQRSRQAVGIQEQWTQFMRSEEEAKDQIEKMKLEQKDLKKEIQKLKGSSVDSAGMLKNAESIKPGGQAAKFVFEKVDIDDRNLLSQLADQLRDKLGSAVIVLVGEGAGNYPLIVSVSKDLKGKAHAGNILKEVAGSLGGKGGGRPDFAQGGAKDISKLDEAKTVAFDMLN